MGTQELHLIGQVQLDIVDFPRRCVIKAVDKSIESGQ
jgi:hypothetical protein